MSKVFKQLRSHNIRSLWGQNSVVVLWLLLLLVLNVIQADYESVSELRQIVANNTALMVTVAGLSLVMIGGGIDFSIGYQMSLTAVVISKLSVAQQPEWMIVSGALCTGFICGLFNGVLVSYLEIVPFAATIATQIIFRGISYLVSGGSMVTNLSTIIRGITRSYFLKIRADFWIGVFAFLFLFVILRLTLQGKALRAIGLNEDQAKRSGLPVKKIKCEAYCIAGVFYSIATMILISRRGYAGSETGIGMEITAIIAAYIGGVLSLAESQNILLLFLGTMIVAAVEGSLPKVGITTYLQYIITGMILIITMLLHKKRKNNTYTQKNKQKE